ncbi:MAG: hypothetical protein CMM45_05375 [Rhodospirillaceae bacterium]|nr:hypothetical protein [Rhodospirillaceae bacterium]
MAVGFRRKTEFPNKVRCSVPVLLSNYRSPHSIVAKPVSLNQRQVHGTAIMLWDQGVLLRGPSGAGKSDLALRLIDCGAVLVADDRVNLTRAKDSVQMSAPTNLLGKLEIRGLGIVQMACVPSAPLAMVCDLVPADQIDRIPDVATETIFDQLVPLVVIDSRTQSAAARVRYALKVAQGEIGLTK